MADVEAGEIGHSSIQFIYLPLNMNWMPVPCQWYAAGMTFITPTGWVPQPAQRPRALDTSSLWLALAITGFGLVPLFARHLLEAGLSPEAIALYRFGLVLLLTVPVLPRILRTRAKRGPALLLAGAGLAMGLAWSMYLKGLDAVPVALAGTIYMTYPLFVLLLAWVWLRQPIQRRAVLAGGLILAGASVLLAGTNIGLEELAPGLLLCLPAPLAFALIAYRFVVGALSTTVELVTTRGERSP